MSKKLKKYFRGGAKTYKSTRPGVSAYGRRPAGMSAYTLANRYQSPVYGSMAMYGCPFPREFTTKLTYSDNVSLTATLGVPATYLYATNDLYDPNVTGVGLFRRINRHMCPFNL